MLAPENTELDAVGSRARGERVCFVRMGSSEFRRQRGDALTT